MWQASLYARHFRIARAVIISDSLSALRSIADDPDPGGWVRLVQESVTAALPHCQVVLLWCPGHIGVQGNEIADGAARLASGGVPCPYPVPLRDGRSHLKEVVRGWWQHRWGRNRCQLYLIQPSVEDRVVYSTLSRLAQVGMCRLRIGHTNATHLFLLSGDERPQCHHCHEVMTVPHFFTCPYIRDRSGLAGEWKFELLRNTDNHARILPVLKSLGIRV